MLLWKYLRVPCYLFINGLSTAAVLSEVAVVTAITEVINPTADGQKYTMKYTSGTRRNEWIEELRNYFKS